jgi:hypothetical protein
MSNLCIECGNPVEEIRKDSTLNFPEVIPKPSIVWKCHSVKCSKHGIENWASITPIAEHGLKNLLNK